MGTGGELAHVDQERQAVSPHRVKISPAPTEDVEHPVASLWLVSTGLFCNIQIA